MGESFIPILQVALFMGLAWLGGRLFKTINLSALVGELIVGVIMGPEVLDLVPHPEAFSLFGRIGVMLLVLESGLEVELDQVKKLGVRALLLALVGTLVPLGLGMLMFNALGFPLWSDAFVAGAALAPTSLGMAAKVLKEMNYIHSCTGQLITTAAVIDDVLSLLLLSLLEALSGDVTWWTITQPIVSALAFCFVGTIVAFRMPRYLPRILMRIPDNPHSGKYYRRDALLGMLFCFAILMSYVAGLLTSFLLGTFLAGLAFSSLKETMLIWKFQVKRVASWLTRMFFAATIAFEVPVGDMFVFSSILKGLVMAVVAVGAKLPTGLLASPIIPEGLMVGWAMVARGEFCFLVAREGKELGLLSQSGFSVIIWPLVICAIVSPIFFRLAMAWGLKRKAKQHGSDEGGCPGDAPPIVINGPSPRGKRRHRKAKPRRPGHSDSATHTYVSYSDASSDAHESSGAAHEAPDARPPPAESAHGSPNTLAVPSPAGGTTDPLPHHQSHSQVEMMIDVAKGGEVAALRGRKGSVRYIAIGDTSHVLERHKRHHHHHHRRHHHHHHRRPSKDLRRSRPEGYTISLPAARSMVWTQADGNLVTRSIFTPPSQANLQQDGQQVMVAPMVVQGEYTDTYPYTATYSMSQGSYSTSSSSYSTYSPRRHKHRSSRHHHKHKSRRGHKHKHKNSDRHKSHRHRHKGHRHRHKSKAKHKHKHKHKHKRSYSRSSYSSSYYSYSGSDQPPISPYQRLYSATPNADTGADAPRARNIHDLRKYRVKSREFERNPEQAKAHVNRVAAAIGNQFPDRGEPESLNNTTEDLLLAAMEKGQPLVPPSPAPASSPPGVTANVWRTISATNIDALAHDEDDPYYSEYEDVGLDDTVIDNRLSPERHQADQQGHLGDEVGALAAPLAAAEPLDLESTTSTLLSEF